MDNGDASFAYKEYNITDNKYAYCFFSSLWRLQSTKTDVESMNISLNPYHNVLLLSSYDPKLAYS